MATKTTTTMSSKLDDLVSFAELIKRNVERHRPDVALSYLGEVGPLLNEITLQCLADANAQQAVGKPVS